MRRMRLTIIIPAHNEELRIGRMLDAYLPYFTERYGRDVEFLAVVNGSTDRTADVVASYAARFPGLRSIVEPKPIGKGGALIVGFKAAQGDLVGFVDADGATPPEAFDELVARIGPADAIIASRWAPGAKVSPRQPLDRRLASRTFNGLTRLLFGLRLTDTQCGAKLLRRETVQRVLPALGITRWAFDVDLLFQIRRAGCRIVEIPTVWHDVEGSKVDVTRASTEMLLALVRLRLLYSSFHWLVALYDRLIAPWAHPAGTERDGLFTHSVIMMAGGQFAGVLNMLFQIVMVRMLTADRYGDLAAMLGILMVVGTPLGALSGAVTHFTSHFLADRTPGRIAGMLKAVTRDLAIPAGIILVVAAAGQRGLQEFFNLTTPWPILLTALILLVSVLGIVPGGVIVGGEAFEGAALTGTVCPAIRLASGAALVALGLAASGALAGHLLGAVASTAISVWLAVRALRRRTGVLPAERRTLAWARGFLGTAVCERPAGFYAYALWFGIASVGYGVLSSADVVMAKHYFVDPHQAGAFAKAAMIARIVFFLVQPIAGALFPKVTSEGSVSPRSARLLVKGMVFAGAVLMVAGGFCLAFPGWLLRVLADTRDPGLEPVVRGMVLAMMPLSLGGLLMNYELAQRRFAVVLPLVICAAAYVLGVAIWHDNPLQIVLLLALSSTACFVAIVACLPWSQFKKK